jgi:hypothetical protein
VKAQLFDFCLSIFPLITQQLSKMVLVHTPSTHRNPRLATTEEEELSECRVGSTEHGGANKTAVRMDEGTGPSTTKERLPACRFPAELMINIIDFLANDGSQATLAALQSTSSEMYNLATPALYRRLDFPSVRQTVRFFRLFASVTPRDRLVFL